MLWGDSQCKPLFIIGLLFLVQDRRTVKENGRAHFDGEKTDKRVIESGDSSGYESGAQTNISLWRKQEPEEQ